MKWFRWYHEGIRDEKLLGLSYEHRWLWTVILTLASESPIRGYLYFSKDLPFDAERIARQAYLPIEVTEQGIELMKQLKMLDVVDGVLHVTNWEKRQFASDSSADRTRRYRQRLKESEGARDVTVTPSDIQITDIYDTPPYIPPQGGECAKPSSRGKREYTPDFEEFWSIYPRKVNKVGAFKKWRARLKEKGGPTKEQLIQAARNYADYCHKRGTEEEFILHAATFLGPQERWKDFLEPVKVSAIDSTPRTYTGRPSDVALLRRQMREAGELG